METFSLENQKRLASKYSHYWAKPAWIYQFGNTFGFRFGPLPKEERGILVGIVIGSESITEQQALSMPAGLSTAARARYIKEWRAAESYK